MRKLYVCLIMVLMSMLAYSQNDTVEKYISVSFSNTTNIGNQLNRLNAALEIGKQWDGVFSLGLCGGFTCGDKNPYVELRPNLNIFEVGRFVNTFTPGIGYVFDSKNPKETSLLEFSSGIEYSYSPTLHINLFFGQYYYTGKTSSSSLAFVGLSIVKFSKAVTQKGLIH